MANSWISTWESVFVHQILQLNALRKPISASLFLMQIQLMTAKTKPYRSLYLLIFPFIGLLPLIRTNIDRPLDCRHKIRLGDSYGGWITCKPIKSLKGKLVYTIGIGRNIEWDKAMIDKYGTLHHGWDPTPTAEDFFTKTPPPKGFTFHNYGLGTSDGNVTLKLPEGNHDSYTVMDYHQKAQPGTVTSVQMLSLDSMMRKAKHSRLAVLKVDIEGAEFDVIDSWNENNYSIPADQVLIEFHERYFKGQGSLLGTAIERMRNLGFDLVHKTKLEYTFAKRSAINSLTT